MKVFRIGMWSVVAVLIVFRGYEYFSSKGASLHTVLANATVLEKPVNLDLAGGPLDAVTEAPADYKLLFFGFTNCPGACPLGMATLKREYGRLLENQRFVDVFFVSIDPARDTEEKTLEFAKGYNADFSAVVIPEDELAAVTKQFGVYAERDSEHGGMDGGYTLMHSTQIFVVRGQQLVALYGTPLEIGNLASDLRELVLKRL